MKIKIDFVSNSSSTTYIAVLPSTFDINDFYKELGPTGKSPISEFLAFLYENIKYESTSYEDYINKQPNEWALNLPIRIRNKIEVMKKRGATIRVGHFSSDGNFLEQYFCMSSFEIDSQNIYINMINCFW